GAGFVWRAAALLDPLPQRRRRRRTGVAVLLDRAHARSRRQARTPWRSGPRGVLPTGRLLFPQQRRRHAPLLRPGILRLDADPPERCLHDRPRPCWIGGRGHVPHEVFQHDGARAARRRGPGKSRVAPPPWRASIIPAAARRFPRGGGTPRRDVARAEPTCPWRFHRRGGKDRLRSLDRQTVSAVVAPSDLLALRAGLLSR